MPNLLIFVATMLLMAGRAIRADDRFRACPRLPMQWSLSGGVRWTAPRRVGLAMMPVVAGAILATIALVPPRPGQEVYRLPVMLITAAGMIAVQMLHLRLIGRTLPRK